MDAAKLFYLKRHPCSSGLEEQAIRELAEQMELVTVEIAEEIYRGHEAVRSIAFVVEGRLRQARLDLRGGEVDESFLTQGSHFGILAAAQEESVPVKVVAEEPSMLLRLDFQKAMALPKVRITRPCFTRSMLALNTVSLILISCFGIITPR